MNRTFKDAFAQGNTAEIELHGWRCEECGKLLSFRLTFDATDEIEWLSRCCSLEYSIYPVAAAYNTRKV